MFPYTVTPHFAQHTQDQPHPRAVHLLQLMNQSQYIIIT